MAKALADAVGMTKRQVQFWSDHGVLQFLPGSGGTRGNQRLYPRTELPFAAMAGALAASGIQIGTIRLATDLVRIELSNSNLPGANPSKFRRWLRGEAASYILVRTFPAMTGDGYEQGVTWVPEKDLKKKYLKWDHAMTVINVKLVMSPHVG
jgi:DNA-binding transcriptional MerR regulator